MPTIYNRSWYNGFEEKNEMYIGNKISILIGMLWMRQLRVKKSKCDEIICCSVTSSTGVSQRLSANHKMSLEQKNRSSFILDESQN